ncbi:tRNA lysidine(34) synthetase TilS [Thalassolituus sp. LLYu03]|uniref:tRNA lysidine(34) synthetase TilS n=1 Tax=Thalassolituus sp. LLYu03 TaxID=3421656 RepID=UPI003D2AEA8A
MPPILSDQLLNSLPPEGDLWVGFSGGLDSSVLLAALARLPLQGRLRAIHVHHGLSANADAWLAHCQRVCAGLQVPLVCERVTLTDTGDGIENAAREARYQAFARHLHKGDTLLLAHHADDQLETFFQRLLRGSGLTGLAAMAFERELQPGIRLLRPLLGWERTQLEQLAHDWSLSWVNDESNQDSRYERNWWRNQLLPQIAERFPGRKASLLRSLSQLQQDKQALALLLAPHIDACTQTLSWPLTRPLALNVAALRSLPPALLPYVVRGWLERCALPLPSAQWLTTLLNEVMAAGDDRQPQLMLGELSVRRFRDWLCLTEPVAMPAPVLMSDIALIADAGMKSDWAGAALQWSAELSQSLPAGCRLLPAEQARGLTLRMCGRPAKGLKALFQEAGVPVWLRPLWPVLVADVNGAPTLLAVANIGAGAGLNTAATAAHGPLLRWG